MPAVTPVEQHEQDEVHRQLALAYRHGVVAEVKRLTRMLLTTGPQVENGRQGEGAK